MVSVIICSVNAELLSNIEKNVKETIGVPYEMIVIDNTAGRFGICGAYNAGADKAKFPFLCFTHEDVLFETKNWGYLACRHFDDRRTGLLGVAGGKSKSAVPSSWSIPEISSEINVVQHEKTGKKVSRHILKTAGTGNATKEEVVVVDGVWLFTKKETVKQFPFDEITFPGFHGYDIDLSLQVNSAYKVYVVFNIIIHHYSEGVPDKRWMQSAIGVSRKWKKQLPVSVHELSRAELKLLHWNALRVYLQHLFRLQYNRVVIIRSFFSYAFTKYFSFRPFLSLGKYILVEMYRFRMAAVEFRNLSSSATGSVRRKQGMIGFAKDEIAGRKGSPQNKEYQKSLK